MRLFCFHHAGGGKSTFRTWSRALGPGVEVVPVEVADRDRFTTLHQLVEELNERLGPELAGPHVFFGHSFGALLAYRWACLRVADGSRLPDALLLSSYVPPHLPAPLPSVDHLDDSQLAALLSDLGGLPTELAEWPALRDKAVAAARTDLRLCMTDDDAVTSPLPCPMHVFGGDDDPLVSESDLQAWRSRTSAEFSVNILPGDHFYLDDSPALFAAIRSLLSRIAAA